MKTFSKIIIDCRQFFILLIIWIAIYIPTVNLTPAGVFHDDAVYLLASKSLLNGKYNLPGNQDPNYTIPYPPGFPLLLAPVSVFSPSNYNY
ncbi:MAG: hypothetical protein AB1633_12850, partial [Elusimicrobiota bacterium]